MLHLLRGATRRIGIHIWRLLTRPLDSRPQPQPAAVALRFLTAADSAALWTDPALELGIPKAAEALGRGDVCVGAFDGSRLAGYAWFATQPAPHVDGIWMAFEPSAVYIYRALVRREYRGRGIAPALYGFADAFFLERGRAYALICVSIHNAPSIAAAKRSGARTAGYTAYWSAGPSFLAVRSAGAKRCGFRFYRPRPAC